MARSHITDITIINKELKGYEQIEMPFNFKKDTYIKYITALNNEEVFSTGGKFLKYGNDKIYLQNGSFTWSVNTKLRDNNSNIIYKSKFFIPKKSTKKDIEKINLEQIIISQQKVINKMTNNIENLNKDINNKNNIIKKYENLIKSL